ncbi:putative dihydroxyacetone kinase subunit DhaL [Selenomonas ruminantium subsp. lactilytica TAM6421]|uniref:phosphoenolpyruvate--glycerone phosphotransferase n=1 Tax=Selenomonas ruminantium subsp. lactilytica (strain NBRC 103574 / TAM6421) TaxID=927704 RepID=I0GSL1_SELRL|nr:dihydroxyacetone kinase subunit DhaL [Selenomonas ruminantium]BAL83748.1 putative dihydroxyacetone kinase subunit DhaL [Selenomonas ruminantium subsp. lactilytica TAM6421]
MFGKDYMLDALEAISRDIIEHEEELNHLDNVIGDGDHGTNMARFARIILRDLPELKANKDNMGEILQHVGMRCITEIGGSAGPLFGKFYLQAGMIKIDNLEMEEANLVAAFEEGAMGVAHIGRSTEGEKTMLDALFPAVRAMQQALEEGHGFVEILQAGAEAAGKGVEYTKTIQASKGRAAYIGERSIGHQDPGATTVMLMLQSMCRTAAARSAGLE